MEWRIQKIQTFRQNLLKVRWPYAIFGAFPMVTGRDG
jgi:hypothetical protein